MRVRLSLVDLPAEIAEHTQKAFPKLDVNILLRYNAWVLADPTKEALGMGLDMTALRTKERLGMQRVCVFVVYFCLFVFVFVWL